MNILCSDPDIFTLDNFLSNDECDEFIKIVQGSLQRALVVNGKEGAISNGRTGSNCWINHDHNNITKNVADRIAKLVNMPLENAENFQIIYYGLNEQYYNHYDSWLHDYSETTLRCIKYGGMRLVTALVYLNDVELGGGTKMTKLNITINAVKGKILVFNNVYKDTNNRHPLSEHAGLPVIKGCKYAFNLWFKECPKNKLYQDFNPKYYIKLNNINHYKEFKSFDTNIKNIIDKTIFTKISNRESGWINKYELPLLTKTIETMTGINSNKFENYNVIKYNNSTHLNFSDAYNLDSPHIYNGQRIYTVVFFLADFEYKFPQLNLNYMCKENHLLI